MKAHHLPQFLLRNFAIDDLIWFYRKDGSKLINTSPCKVFFQKDLYIQHEFDENFKLTGKKDASVEHQLASHEGKVDSILKKVIGSSKKEKIRISDEERFHINKFLFLLGIRSPDREKHYRENSPDGKKIKAFEDGTKSDYGDTPDVSDELNKNSRAQKISEILNDKDTPVISDAPGISIGYSIGHQFITGNFPCGFLLDKNLSKWLQEMTFPKVHQIEDSMYHGLWIPISPNIALVSNAYGEEEVVDIPNQYVDKINANIYENSTQIAAASKTVIESVLKYCQ